MKNWPPHREIPSVVLPLAMVISTATYPGEAYWFKGSSLTDTQVHEAITDIRRRYEAGVPFYTKETIRKLAQQLECARERQHSDGDMISVKALDGTAVDFKIESGRILTLDKMGVERILYMITIAQRAKTTNWPYTEHHLSFITFPCRSSRRQNSITCHALLSATCGSTIE